LQEFLSLCIDEEILNFLTVLQKIRCTTVAVFQRIACICHCSSCNRKKTVPKGSQDTR